MLSKEGKRNWSWDKNIEFHPPPWKAARFSVGWGTCKLDMRKNKSYSKEGGVYVGGTGFSDMIQICGIAIWAGDGIHLCPPSDESYSAENTALTVTVVRRLKLKASLSTSCELLRFDSKS